MAMKKVILTIEGMHCGSCANSLAFMLDMKGIKAKVDFNSKKAILEYDPKKIDLKSIKKDIEDIGYTIK